MEQKVSVGENEKREPEDTATDGAMQLLHTKFRWRHRKKQFRPACFVVSLDKLRPRQAKRLGKNTSRMPESTRLEFYPREKMGLR